MPFDLTNAPATFQNSMNYLFRPHLRKFTLVFSIVFYYDILVYSKSAEEHLHPLKQVFSLMRLDQLFVKQSKYEFMTKQVAHLGHVITRDEVAVDLAKVSDMLS